MKAKFVSILYHIVCISSCSVLILNQRNVNKQFTGEKFMQMNGGCYISAGEKYGCDDIPDILNYDPDKNEDIKYVCNKTKIGEFTNQQLADRVNLRFKEAGFGVCNVNVFNKFEGIQFKNQCPTIVSNYCDNNYKVISA